jgi:hypothetical protein
VRGGVLVGALVAAVSVGALLAAALSQTASRLADVEPTRSSNFWTVLAPKATVCESGMTVPADARAVSVVVGLFSWSVAAR